MRQLHYKSFSKMRADRLVWRLDSSRLRILCYHGVCEDRLANAAWMPHFFVTESVFESHLQYLQRHACVLPLEEASVRLRNGSLPPRCVSLTFDDGYANNLHLASPLLQKYGMSAVIFLSSAYIESGELFPFLRLKLIRHIAGRDLPEGALPDYKTVPLDVVTERAEPWWAKVKTQLTDDQHAALRPLTIQEVKTLDTRLISLGAHTHTHCILSNERSERRSEEIRTSVRMVAAWGGQPVRLFSYPNGQRGDFDESDKQILRREGVDVAVTGTAGANSSRIDPLALRRYPIGIFHDDESSFCAELTGFRSVLRSVAGSASR